MSFLKSLEYGGVIFQTSLSSTGKNSKVVHERLSQRIQRGVVCKPHSKSSQNQLLHFGGKKRRTTRVSPRKLVGFPLFFSKTSPKNPLNSFGNQTVSEDPPGLQPLRKFLLGGDDPNDLGVGRDEAVAGAVGGARHSLRPSSWAGGFGRV